MTRAAAERPRPHWRPAYVGLGSNLDDPVAQLRQALAALAALPDTRLVRASPLYRSAPLDGSAQPDFVNAVAALLTQSPPLGLLHALQGIEAAQGRRRDAGKWGPRSLDLDLLVFGNEKICNDELTVPHPGLAKRNFVLMPLNDIAPALQVPGLASVARLLEGLPEGGPAIARIEPA